MTTKEFQERSLLRIFLSYFKPHRRLFALDMTCAFLIALVDLAFPLVSRTAMYTWLPEKQFRVFFIVMAAVVVTYAVRSGLYFVVAYWGHTFGIRVEADIRRDLYHHMQELGFDFYDRNRTGQLMSRLTSDLFEVTELAHHGPEDLFISVVTIVGALIVMFCIRWELALVLLILLPVLLLAALRRRKQMSAASRAAKQKTGSINAAIESGLSGVRTTKAFANEDAQQERFDEANEVFKTAKRGFHKEMGFFTAVMEFFTNILPVAVIAVGGWLIMEERMDYVDLITFSLYVTSFVSPIRKLANFAEMFSNGFAGLNRFAELMRTEPSIQDAPDAVELKDVRGQVDVDHVSFTYTGETEVLHDVSLSVPAGETVALVGPSGGGKTTVSRLAARFWDYQKGSITVGGMEVSQIDPEKLMSLYSIVFQDVTLFDNTILENIRLGRKGATDEEVLAAAKLANCEEFAEKLPDKWNTNIGENGCALSGGERQRISIARAFLKDAPIILLDEATASLDVENETAIQEALSRLIKHKTVLIIAHRMRTVAGADKIVVLSGGIVAEQGSPAELYARKGLYTHMVDLQSASQNWTI